MTMKTQIALLVVALLALFSGCMNMPTPVSQITPSYISGLRYEDFDCSRLAAEMDSLARRENQLVIAQEQRIKTSEIQAFWWGYGQGDGIEASELANVRGEKEAMRRAMERKRCEEGIPSTAQDHILPSSTEEKTVKPAGVLQEQQFGKTPDERLEELKRLKDKNLITDEEYENKRKQILEGL
jgi:hypothetical protein